MFCGYKAEGDVMLQTKNYGNWGGGGPGYYKYGERGRYMERKREREGKERNKHLLIQREKDILEKGKLYK